LSGIGVNDFQQRVFNVNAGFTAAGR